MEWLGSMIWRKRRCYKLSRRRISGFWRWDVSHTMQTQYLFKYMILILQWWIFKKSRWSFNSPTLYFSTLFSSLTSQDRFRKIIIECYSQDDSNKTILSEKKFSKECIQCCVTKTRNIESLEELLGKWRIYSHPTKEVANSKINMLNLFRILS